MLSSCKSPGAYRRVSFRVTNHPAVDVNRKWSQNRAVCLAKVLHQLCIILSVVHWCILPFGVLAVGLDQLIVSLFFILYTFLSLRLMDVVFAMAACLPLNILLSNLITLLEKWAAAAEQKSHFIISPLPLGRLEYLGFIREPEESRHRGVTRADPKWMPSKNIRKNLLYRPGGSVSTWRTCSAFEITSIVNIDNVCALRVSCSHGDVK